MATASWSWFTSFVMRVMREWEPMASSSAPVRLPPARLISSRSRSVTESIAVRPACVSRTREDRRWAVRLLGLRAGKLVEAGAAQMSFFANTRDLEREERLETAVDALRERFGGGSVRRGTVLEKKEREGE